MRAAANRLVFYSLLDNPAIAIRHLALDNLSIFQAAFSPPRDKRSTG